MANQKEAQGGLEWRVTAPIGSSVVLEPRCGSSCKPWLWIMLVVSSVTSKMLGFFDKAWKMGADDPRKVIHGVKVGLALSLCSLFYYTRPLYYGVGGAAMWAVLTVVVVFEFTVGGCLYKGLNRAIATTTAGSLAIGVHWIANRSGKTVEPVIISASVFFLASAATFSRFLPTIKAKFDYGVTIFILTFSLVAVSGYRVDELLRFAEQRMSTIVIGVSICLLVCILVRPVWAGQDLHRLIVRNMERVANSLEGCVEEYFERDEDVAREKTFFQKTQGYKCVLNSKASEDSLANLARWEPAHGRFALWHPWSQYLKVGVAVRYCAYCIEALHGCINSEIESPESLKEHLSEMCTRLSLQSSKVLKELAKSIKSMKRSPNIGFLVGEMNNAVEELHNSLQSLPSEAIQLSVGEDKRPLASTGTSASLMDALPLITVASLLAEITTRIEGVVEAVDRLADLVGFSVDDSKILKQVRPITEQHVDTNNGQEEELKVLQQV